METSLRGVRYCEIISVTNDGGLSADVYGTQGLSECPAEQWEALDPEAIQEELGALAIVMNGPRYWLIDAVTSFSEIGESRFFGELEMRLIASIVLSPGDLSQDPYTERSVVRDTEFVFDAGNEVYELIAPNGKVYVMQSYAQIVDETLDEDALPTLGETLQLPEGWAYQARILEQDFIVVDQDGIATVIQDELQNTYQLTEAQ
ncbi:MAG: hypothetical protein KJO40_05160 [Deltaproteobacteria bacterium]|nr:hypothetical protein [Deltaproteobacteria bacterium]NND29658.1 hypothetical protein [Myxococcales bacterium]MBT8463877.1 hypothetical protein [Deltaproteobacteria bacterium]MBT8480936.1 hypothetical protein [Deltaproteobacteria bacterium]NNK09662.1 hypothetical protein [Myxococcales bacterium]